MTARQSQPTKRLLIAPTLLLGGILAVVIAVPGTTERPNDTTLQVTELPPVLPDIGGCERDSDRPELTRAPLPASAGRVTSELVLSCPGVYDGVTVTYTGELVGDLLPRDGGAWVQVNDDAYALTHGPLPSHRERAGTNSSLNVWLPDELLGEVTGLGRPGRRGDVVRIEGPIRRTDTEDGGGLTLRAEHLLLLRPARPIAEPLDRPQAALAAASLLAATSLITLRRRDARR